jgi:hypothetical protein
MTHRERNSLPLGSDKKVQKRKFIPNYEEFSNRNRLLDPDKNATGKVS